MSRMVTRAMRTTGTVAFDAVSSANSGNNSATLSWTHTAGASATCVVVIICGGSTQNIISKTQALSITYGGIAMSAGPGVQNLATFTNTTCCQQMWFLMNPPTGAQTVTMLGGAATGTFGSWEGCGLSYTGVESVGSWLGTGTTTGTATSTGAIECFSGAMAVSSHCNNSSSGSFSSPSGTSRFTISASTTRASQIVQDVATSSTTVTLTATAPGSSQWEADGLILYPTNCGFVGTIMSSGTGGVNFNGVTGTSTTLGTSFTTASLAATDGWTAAIVTVSMSITTVSGTLTCGVTYNGVSMTQIDLQQGAATSGNEAVGIYVLLNPPTGAQSVVVTTGGTTSKTEIVAMLQVYANVGTWGTTVNVTSTSTAPSVTVSSAITSRVIAISAVAAAYSSWNANKHIYFGSSVTGTGDYTVNQDRMGVVAGAALSGVMTSGRWRMMGVELLAA